MNETNFEHGIINHNGIKYEENEILYKQFHLRLLLLAYKFDKKKQAFIEKLRKDKFHDRYTSPNIRLRRVS